MYRNLNILPIGQRSCLGHNHDANEIVISSKRGQDANYESEATLEYRITHLYKKSSICKWLAPTAMDNKTHCLNRTIIKHNHKQP